ncbi:MAG: alkaline phosphatase family protein [Terriglobia bacterium]|jgi:arylsulfatase A-like enzyme|nr:alkaline phosphatase family protein [Terriglobia bacterium]
MKRISLCIVAALLVFPVAGNSQQAPRKTTQRNVIVFVADGLRHGSVNAKDTPALWMVRTQGVNFENSYSLYPTLTTANASAIATGHRLGDTGDFANALYTGYRIFDSGNFDRTPGTITPFVESDQVLADLDSHFGGNYLNETTLLQAARANDFNTAAIGKGGPTAIQDAAAINPQEKHFVTPPTIIIDDFTAYKPWNRMDLQPKSIPLPTELIARMTEAGIPLDAPARNNGFAESSAYSNGNDGDAQTPGTLRANDVQQQWMVDVTTKAVLPMFVDSGKPFVMVFWSRDPDATQHNQGDSFQKLTPGINGPTSKAAVENADRCLGQLLAWLDKHPEVKASTDVFVTSDHGFATISRHEIDRTAKVTSAESAQHLYYGANGKLVTNKEFLPSGFLAIDLAWALQTNLWDPDNPAPAGSKTPYKQVHLATDETSKPVERWEHPRAGSALLGQAVYKADGSDAMAIVVANGGSDLIYVPDNNTGTVQHILKALLEFDYVGAIFVDDRYGKLPGTLPLSAISLVGSAVTPRPAMVVAFKTFYMNPGDLMQGIQISDGGLQEGQGNHGGFGRECTWNNMAAIGPDFKKQSVDPAPVGNADITPTLAKILDLKIPSNGKLGGRVIEEALAGQKDAGKPPMTWIVSDPAENSVRTVLFLEEYGGQKYFHSACMTSEKMIEPGLCQK